MKILHLVETFASLGGAEIYLRNEIQLLADAGIENIVIYWKEHPDIFENVECPIHYIPETGSTMMERLKNWIEAWNPSIVALHTVRNPEIIALTSRMKPTIAYVHDFISVCPGLAKFYKIGQEICTRPYGLGCAAMIYLRRCASARHPLSVYRVMQTPPKYMAAYRGTKKVVVATSYMKDLLIQNGLNPEHITKVPTYLRIQHSQTPYEKGDEPTKILFIGRLEEEKGLPFLIEALAHVSQPFQLIVAGSGSRLEAYKELVERKEIAGQVEFIGWLKDKALQEIYRKTAFLVFPSIWPEPFGMVGLEAFHSSRPVIAFNVGGLSDWLIDGENGFLVPLKDIDTLAQRIETLLGDPELARQMGANAFDFAASHYSGSNHLQAMMRIYEEALE